MPIPLVRGMESVKGCDHRAEKLSREAAGAFQQATLPDVMRSDQAPDRFSLARSTLLQV